MPSQTEGREPAASAGLVIVTPSGNRSRVPLQPLPFLIGRQADNHLVLRDNRASRTHAQIVAEDGEYVIEDLKSRHGVFVNGERVNRRKLTNSDRIEFGFGDSYKLIFTLEEDEIHRILDQISSPPSTPAPGAGNLAKLRALVEVARALQSSLSIDDVLAAVVDAALAVTGAERGFLLLREDPEMRVAVSRDRAGAPLKDTDLRVPTSVINRALRTRRELLSMNFDPMEEQGVRPEMSVADLELRSVVCVPLVRVRAGSVHETVITSVNDTVGLLYMDSRRTAADLSAGNRELLQTLALEASTILENARLLEEEREKQRMEEELNVARQIQHGLLPSEMPSSGWFRASGSSIASRLVGGDYFDVRPAGADKWVAVVADVSGKGVSSALLASLLQGAFLLGSDGLIPMEEMMRRVNHFLNDRTRGEKYATVFYSTLNRAGLLRWVNTGHPRPIVLGRGGETRQLASTGLPLGMLEDSTYQVSEAQLQPGDKLVIFSDGLSEAENSEGEFFEKQQLRRTLHEHTGEDCAGLLAALERAVEAFADTSVPADDITIVVAEYRPDGAL